MILTVDLGTSATKAVLWGDDGVVAVGRSAVPCRYEGADRVEQDARSWWPSVVDACAEARSQAPSAFATVEGTGFSSARQTFVPTTADAIPLGPALVWSDRRAVDEARALVASFDGVSEVHRRTGMVLDAAAPAAKVAWLDHHEPDRLRHARWLLSPRDLVLWHLTGEVSTDPSLASATGFFDTTGGDIGAPVEELAGKVVALLPPVRPSASVAGALLPGAAEALGLRAGIPVVTGAGDRACEVLGAGASPERPMVSWGTTANVSVPVGGRPDPVPEAMVATSGALGGWLLEGGLSAAGSAVEWLARLTGVPPGELMERAGTSAPGSGGIVALPWFGGARAPWWSDGARGAFLGLSLDHDLGHVARALVESVAWDVVRCLDAAARAVHRTPTAVALGGGGARIRSWVEILTAVSGLAARRRRSGEAASAGAALLVAEATGTVLDLERLDPVVEETQPEPSALTWYKELRPRVDAAAGAVLAWGGTGGGDTNDGGGTVAMRRWR